MKNILKQALALSLALLLSVTAVSLQAPGTVLTVSAHSGRTDANGGHHDYKNKSGLGSYHYHHGYPAHLHENGICPYDNPQPDVIETQPAMPEIDPVFPEVPAADAVPAIDYTLVFDAAFYAAANPDVAAVCGTDPALLFQHFLTTGMQEGRQGNASFNVFLYKAANPDLAAVFGDDLIQYYTYYCMSNG